MAPVSSLPQKRRPNRRRGSAAVPAAAVEVLHRPSKRRDQEVLDVAAQLFYERGFTHASVQDVADALNISKGSLYHYIDEKEDLLFRIVEQLHDETQAMIEKVAAAEGLTPLERLRLYVRLRVQFDLENISRVAVYHNDFDRLNPARRALTVGRRRLHERYVVDLIEAARRDGQTTPDLDPRLLTNFIQGAVIGIYRWYRPQGRFSRDEVAEACAEFVLMGVVGDE
jgi:AcrR family transcriptional regulator